MSRTSIRVLVAVAAAVVTASPVGAASSAGATTRSASRQTTAVDVGKEVADGTAFHAADAGLDGRSLVAMRHAVREISTDLNAYWGKGFLTVSGLSDRNHDGLDDDGRMTVRVLDNRSVVTMRRNRTYAVADDGFVFKNSRSVLKESAQSVDRALRLIGRSRFDPSDPWDMEIIRQLKAEAAPGVTVLSDVDGNHDGYDDDGRLTFLAGGKAVTLTIGNTPKQAGTVTYGPTWETKAPERVHHPIAPPWNPQSAQPASRGRWPWI